MIKISIRIQSFNINSQRLFKELVKEINTAIRDLKFDWSDEEQRQSFVDMITDWMKQTYEEPGKVSQVHIVGDDRINTSEDADNGIYKVEVRYRQKDCLNTSRILYTCTRKSTTA